MAEKTFSIIPHLVVRNAAAAIDFYKQYLGFTEVNRMLRPDGKVLHCVLIFRDQALMLAEEFPAAGGEHSQSPEKLGGSSVTIHLNVPDVDAAFAKALQGGAKSAMKPTDMFWGDRYGKIVDPFGHHWSLATHQRDVSPEQMKKEMEAMFAKNKK
jgi:PhnB protein